MSSRRQDGLTFAVGRRRLLTVQRKLVRLVFSLEDILNDRTPSLPDISLCDGVRVRSVPLERRDEILGHWPQLLIAHSRTFRRHYIEFKLGFETYLRAHSAKTRSTISRKKRRLADLNGGVLDVREYRGPDGLEEFLRLAIPLSARTYQARLLRAGLPDEKAAQAEMRALAEEDRFRGFLLFLGGDPIAYLCLPVRGRTVLYQHLGFDDRHAPLSPGTVLQWVALERLFADDELTYFDFTEGESANKTRFSTASVPCQTLLLLKPTPSNRAWIAAQQGFDRTVQTGKSFASALGAEAGVRQIMRL